MAWPPLTTSYVADLQSRGWVFIPQLPANTNLGRTVTGAPGGRSQPTAADRAAGTRPTYELAPLEVQQEMGVVAQAIQQDQWDAAHPILATARDVVSEVAESTGLDHGAVGIAAKVLGVPVWVLFLVLLFVGYAVLRSYGVVPPLKKVIA